MATRPADECTDRSTSTETLGARLIRATPPTPDAPATPDEKEPRHGS